MLYTHERTEEGYQYNHYLVNADFDTLTSAEPAAESWKFSSTSGKSSYFFSLIGSLLSLVIISIFTFLFDLSIEAFFVSLVVVGVFICALTAEHSGLHQQSVYILDRTTDEVEADFQLLLHGKMTCTEFDERYQQSQSTSVSDNNDTFRETY